MTRGAKFGATILMVLVLFGIGLGSGYWFWGRNTEPTDYRKLLLRVANYMESLEQQNSALNDKLAGLERQQEQTATTAADPAQTAELQNLRNENARLRSGMELNAELGRLRAENQALKARLEPAASQP